MSDPFNDYDHWRSHVRASIFAGCIVRQTFDMMQEGKGAPSVEDMQGFAEEAAAVADLWVESLPK